MKGANGSSCWRLLCVGAVVVTFVGTAAVARAVVDAKQLPGVACRSVAQAGQDDLDYVADGGSFVTAPGGTTTVDCPLVTDYPSQTALDSLAVYLKPGTSGNVTCTHTCTDTTGVALESHSYTTTGTSAQTLTWASGYLDGCEENNFWRVYCGLQNGAKIYAIKWGEVQ